MSFASPPTTHARPVFTLDEPEVGRVQFNVPRWSAIVASAEEEDISPNTTPRLGASWSPFVPTTTEGLSPAQVALAAYEASRSRRKRSLTTESSSTASSLSSGEYDDYLTPDTSVASISPCSSPIDLELVEGSNWLGRSKSSKGAELERSDTIDSSASSNASSTTCVLTSEPIARASSLAPSAPLLASRPLLARCLTAPDLGCGMVRSISTPVATQEAHDALLRDMRAELEEELASTKTEQKRALDDVMGHLRLESPASSSLPWPYNRIIKTSPDQQALRPARSGHGSRPSLSRSITFDTSCLSPSR